MRLNFIARLLALSFALTGCSSITILPFAYDKKYLEEKKEFSKGIFYHGKNCHIVLIGEIQNEVSSQLQRLDRIIRDLHSCNNLKITLASRGGNIYPAMAIGRFIRDKEYTTEVFPGSECTSACALIYIAGVKRISQKDDNITRIGLHKPTKLTAGKRECLEYENDVAMKEQYLDYLRSMLKIDAANYYFASTNKSSCESVLYLYGEELLRSGIASASNY